MEQVYFFCAVFGSLTVAVQFLLTVFAGMGVDDTGTGDVETFSNLDQGGETAGEGTDAGISFLRILSLRTVTAGIAFFGLIGMASLKMGVGYFTSFILAFISGLAALLMVYFLYRLICSFRYNGAVTAETLPGSKGNVYLAVPARRAGAGKVIVNHQGRSMEYEAFTDDPSNLAAGTPIAVVKILASNQVLVSYEGNNDEKE